MKQNIGYMLLLSTASLYAASADDQPAVIANTPAKIMHRLIHTGVANTLPAHRATSMGKIYVAIDSSPGGINSLAADAAVADGAHTCYTDIIAHAQLQTLTAALSRFKSRRLSDRMQELMLREWGAEYARLLKERAQTAIAGLTVHDTVSGTIVSNSQLVLSDADVVAFKRVQLAMALGMNRQFQLDEQAFESMCKQYLNASALADLTEQAFIGFTAREICITSFDRVS